MGCFDGVFGVLVEVFKKFVFGGYEVIEYDDFWEWKKVGVVKIMLDGIIVGVVIKM